MNRVIFAIAMVLGLDCQRQLPAAEPNQLTENERLAGWRLLFDGRSTDGWRNYKSEGIRDGWVVEDGALVLKGRGGSIVTNERFESFDLLLDYKISKGGNSGLMFHVAETADAPWMSGPEVQIQDNVDGDDPQKSGWLYGLYQQFGNEDTGWVRDATRPVGEWNQISLRVTPGSGAIAMNGVAYLTFKPGSPDWDERVAKSKFSKYPDFGKAAKGHLCLQDHGDQVAFRNIKIRELIPGRSVPNPVHGELPLKSVLAFPNLKWEGWEPVDDRGRSQTFRPVLVTYTRPGSKRLSVVEQRGRIWNFENDPNVDRSNLFFDIHDRVNYSDNENEEGLLGFAAHPNVLVNGEFFVFYTARPGKKSVISRFRTKQSDPSQLDPTSEEQLLTIDKQFWNHNGGTIAFGPDGYLYIALGDGGAGDDPFDNGQNLNTLFGKILRIDVDHQQDGRPYAIPPDNPFVGRSNARPEIYASGMRNPWRIAFDRQTGHLWCGDVGQILWEEIDIINNGGNYGWSRFEGTHPFGAQVGDKSKCIPPIWEYDHGVGKSITGGFVYRGSRLSELVGKYIYGDYVTGLIWALTYDEAAGRVVSNESIPSNGLPILSFGEDAEGEIYYCVASATGQGIYTIVRQ